jgi:hypothetical protein
MGAPGFNAAREILRGGLRQPPKGHHGNMTVAATAAKP